MDWLNIAAIIVAALGGIGGVAAFITARSSAQESDVRALSQIIDKLRQGYDRLTAENEDLRRQFKELHSQYEHVLAWAKPRGYEPPASGAAPGESGATW